MCWNRKEEDLWCSHEETVAKHRYIFSKKAAEGRRGLFPLLFAVDLHVCACTYSTVHACVWLTGIAFLADLTFNQAIFCGSVEPTSTFGTLTLSSHVPSWQEMREQRYTEESDVRLWCKYGLWGMLKSWIFTQNRFTLCRSLRSAIQKFVTQREKKC